MSTCAELTDAITIAQGQLNNARDNLVLIAEERAELLQRSNGADTAVNESSALVDEIRGDLEAKKRAQEDARIARFAEIDDEIAAIDARLNEILGLLSAANPDIPPPNPDFVQALFGEAATLDEKKQKLLAEQQALLTGEGALGDPGKLQPDIDRLQAELTETEQLRDDALKDRAEISELLIANEARRQSEDDRRADAQAAVNGLQAQIDAQGCDGGTDPEEPDPETDEPETDPEQPDPESDEPGDGDGDGDEDPEDEDPEDPDPENEDEDPDDPDPENEDPDDEDPDDVDPDDEDGEDVEDDSEVENPDPLPAPEDTGRRR